MINVVLLIAAIQSPGKEVPDVRKIDDSELSLVTAFEEVIGKPAFQFHDFENYHLPPGSLMRLSNPTDKALTILGRVRPLRFM